MGEEVTITYETLFELLRIEKMKEELQTLEASFLFDVQSYIEEKNSFLYELQHTADSVQVEKASIQLQNIKRILKDLLDRRERKIVNLALMKARATQLLIDERAFLTHEKKLFKILCEEIAAHHAVMLQQLIPDSNQPKLVHAPDDHNSANSMSKLSMLKPSMSKQDDSIELQPLDEETETEMLEEPQHEQFQTSGLIAVRFLHAVPKFIGTDMQVYGPFEEEDVAKLPIELAKILIKKERAESFDQPGEEGTENESKNSAKVAPSEA